MTKEPCQIEGCNRMSKYNIYRNCADGKKVWLNCCERHEKIIGDENMRRAGGRYEDKLQEQVKRK